MALLCFGWINWHAYWQPGKRIELFIKLFNKLLNPDEITFFSPLLSQIYSLDINNPKDCAKKFISNYNVGVILFVGIILGNLKKKLSVKEENDDKEENHQIVAVHETKNKHL